MFDAPLGLQRFASLDVSETTAAAESMMLTSASLDRHATAAETPFGSNWSGDQGWMVGELVYDKYYEQLQISPDLLTKLAELPKEARVRIARSTYNRKPQYPDAWFQRCIERHWEGTRQPHARASLGAQDKFPGAILGPHSASESTAAGQSLSLRSEWPAEADSIGFSEIGRAHV